MQVLWSPPDGKVTGVSKEALEILNKTGSRGQEGWVCQHLGVTEAVKMNLPEAIHYLTESINIHGKWWICLKDEHKLSLDDQTITSCRMLCLLQITLNKPSDALCTLDQGRARGLVDLLSTKYWIQKIGNTRALNLGGIRELFTAQRNWLPFLGTPTGTIMFWFVNKGGEISLSLFCFLMRSILHSRDCAQCEDSKLVACYERSNCRL